MSCLFTVGITPAEAVNSGMRDWLHGSGFTDKSSNEGQEALAAAVSKQANTSWWLAILPDGAPDLDLVYHIPGSLDNGALKDVIHVLRASDRVEKVGIFIYDLGTAEERSCAPSKLSDLEESMVSFYETGGPACSVYHSFTKN